MLKTSETGAPRPPPEHLTDDQAAVWRAIVDGLPVGHVRRADVPLLAAYVVAAALHRRAAADLQDRGLTVPGYRGRERVNPSHKMLTSQAVTMARLAGKLRLCPAARAD